MGWWFGRKSAPEDARPFVPAWLRNEAAEEGFARSVEGMAVYERTTETWSTFVNGEWELGLLRGAALLINGQQVLGPRAAAIDSPAGGSVVDAESRTAIEAVLAAMREHGLIET